MQICSFFNNIQSEIIKQIKKANSEIVLAVAWFTNIDIFNELLHKLDKKVSVSLLLINDDINNRKSGLDFQHFIDKGGSFYFAEISIPMHNKYMVIDGKIVITGSYNYTYFAEAINDENIIIINGACDIVDSYYQNFKDLTSKLKPIKSIFEYHKAFPPLNNAFGFSHYGIRDMYQQSLILKEKGDEEAAHELVSIIEDISIIEDKPRKTDFTISPVVYKQWKEDYILDQVQYNGKYLIFKYRTSVDDGCWISGPLTKRCWFIRISEDKSKTLKCHKIKNITINGEVYIRKAIEGHIYFINKNNKESFKNNPCGYDVNEENQMVDDNGKIVPVDFIKISGKTEMTCEVYFKTNDSEIINGVIDFIEGEGCESDENFWHCFEINLKLNRQ